MDISDGRLLTPDQMAATASDHEPYDPVAGLIGRDVDRVPTPPVLLDKMLDMAPARVEGTWQAAVGAVLTLRQDFQWITGMRVANGGSEPVLGRGYRERPSAVDRPCARRRLDRRRSHGRRASRRRRFMRFHRAAHPAVIVRATQVRCSPRPGRLPADLR